MNFEYEITFTTEFSYPLEQYSDPEYQEIEGQEIIGVYQIKDKNGFFIEFKFLSPTNFILEYNGTQEVELFQL